MKDLTLLAALFLGCVSGGTYARSCYVCYDLHLSHLPASAQLTVQLYNNISSATEGALPPSCQDFDGDDGRFKSDCPSLLNGCMKIVATDTEGKTYVARDCYMDVLDDSCETEDVPKPLPFKSATVCTCDTDYCNAASDVTPLIYLVTTSLALIAAVVKL